jgi:hypothetical protein
MVTDDLIARLLDATDDAAGASVVEALHKLLDDSTIEADALPKTIAQLTLALDATEYRSASTAERCGGAEGSSCPGVLQRRGLIRSG